MSDVEARFWSHERRGWPTPILCTDLLERARGLKPATGAWLKPSSASGMCLRFSSGSITTTRA